VSASVFPSSTAIYSGSRLAGDATSLRADNGSLYRVNSVLSTSQVTSWYGRIGGVSSSLTSMSVTYRGSHSATCSQSIYLWNWSYGYWVRFSSTTGGLSESEVTFSPTSSLTSYVSGTSVDGEVAVRVHCIRGDSTPFVTSGELMRVTFWKPA
jgi:hypothetical protein